MIVAQGQLTDRPLPRTFAAIATRGFSGQLVIDPGGRDFTCATNSATVRAGKSLCTIRKYGDRAPSAIGAKSRTGSQVRLRRMLGASTWAEEMENSV